MRQFWYRALPPLHKQQKLHNQEKHKLLLMLSQT
jgi:hypothetical protein